MPPNGRRIAGRSGLPGGLPARPGGMRTTRQVTRGVLLLAGPHLEALEAFRDFHDLDFGHACTARPAARPGENRLHRVGPSIDDRLDGPVAAIPHPAGDPEPRGFLAHRVAESHALDAAGDLQMFRHREIFQSGWVRVKWAMSLRPRKRSLP